MQIMAATTSGSIPVLGAFSSDNPHPKSLLKPRPFVNEAGESRDPLLHVAVAQVLPDEAGLHHDDPEQAGDGLAKMEAWASKAAQEGADVVVFPEYFLSGATHDLWRKARAGQASATSDEGEKAWIEVICDVATRNDIDIVAGTVVELGTAPHADRLSDHPVSQLPSDHIPHRVSTKAADKSASNEHEQGLYNTSYYVSRNGQVLHRYTKQNLWHPERETLADSRDTTHPEQHSTNTTFILETKRGTKLRASMAICWDLAWFSRFNQMITPPYNTALVSDLDVEGQAQGPDVIFAPTCWYASDGGPKALLWNGVAEAQMLDSLCQARAVELEALLIMCNVAGPPLDSEAIEDLRQSILRQDQSGSDIEMPLVGLGRSCICSPFLNTVAQVPDEQETLLLQTFDLNILRHAREVYRMRYDHAQN